MLTTELTRPLRISHPLVQVGMAGGAGWQLASAVSNVGALGTLGTSRADDLAADLGSAAHEMIRAGSLPGSGGPYAATALELATR
jgi:NAD(P)H-dependent flavin oxidoreductase YrpB (nitropropane dioxygenase family)